MANDYLSTERCWTFDYLFSLCYLDGVGGFIATNMSMRDTHIYLDRLGCGYRRSVLEMSFLSL